MDAAASTIFSLSMENKQADVGQDGRTRLARQILRREQRQGNVHFPCSTDHEQDWQPYPRLIHALLYLLAILYLYRLPGTYCNLYGQLGFKYHSKLLCSHAIYSGRQACGRTTRGHTGFLHRPSAVLALFFLARRIQPFLSLVDREVEFCVLLGIFTSV